MSTFAVIAIVVLTLAAISVCFLALARAAALGDRWQSESIAEAWAEHEERRIRALAAGPERDAGRRKPDPARR